jgi:hypothetical protein
MGSAIRRYDNLPVPSLISQTTPISPITMPCMSRTRPSPTNGPFFRSWKAKVSSLCWTLRRADVRKAVPGRKQRYDRCRSYPTTASIASRPLLRHSKLLALRCIGVERGVLLCSPDCGRTTTRPPRHHLHDAHLHLDPFTKSVNPRLTFSLTLPTLSPSSTQTSKSPP